MTEVSPTDTSAYSRDSPSKDASAQPSNTVEWVREDPFPQGITLAVALFALSPWLLFLLAWSFAQTRDFALMGGGFCLLVTGMSVAFLANAMSALRSMRIGLDWTRHEIVVEYGKDPLRRTRPNRVVPFSAVRSLALRSIDRGGGTTIGKVDGFPRSGGFGSSDGVDGIPVWNRSVGVGVEASYEGDTLVSPAPDEAPSAGARLVVASLDPAWVEPMETRGDNLPLTEVIFAATDDLAAAQLMAAQLHRELGVAG